MGWSDSATPLIALDAVVLDSETTGLDPRKSWIVEVGAIRLDHGHLGESATFERRVRPPVPIPAGATRIHGIDDAAVADAPSFADVWSSLDAFTGGRVVIGHTIGFDLAVLARECERAGIAWTRPRTLDTRLLAEIAEPNLSDHGLDSVAAWLGVDVAGRHSALGDATATARVFLALLPKLREAGIRTLAEAELACRALTPTLDQQHRAGWVAPVAERAPPATPPRIDSYPYVHRVSGVMSTPARFVAPDMAIGAALERMSQEHVSSLFVLPAGPAARPEHTGIITERDVLRMLAAHGADALAVPVGRAMSAPLACVPADALVHVAIGRMSRLKVRHLGVTDARGLVAGALSARDLLRLRAQDDVLLGDEIDEAADVRGLACGWAKLPRAAASLLAEGIAAREIAVLISRQLGALTHRTAVIAERRMADAGLGAPPCPYAVAVLGSAGREESLLAMDQDNAIVFAQGEPDGPQDRWFAALGRHVADILHEAGVPYCKGGVMGKNAQWRGSIATWRARIAHWIARSDPADLLSVDIFFDLRAVHGDLPLGETIWREAFDAARGNAPFAKLLAEAAGATQPGLNWYGGIRTERGRIDLKHAGLFGIVTAARVLAIRHGVLERGTPARLAAIRALRRGGEADLDALIEAQSVFLDAVLRQQVGDIEHGLPATNRVAVDRLSRRERGRLRDALNAVSNLDDLTRDLLF